MKGEAGGRVVNIDGKTICGSADGGRSAVHVVSARVSEGNIVPGPVQTAEKSNEITAIPDLPDGAELSGDPVTIDATGCQADIARKIREKQADYVRAVKENQKALHTEIKEYFEHLDEVETKELPEGVRESAGENDCGRIARREIRTACGIDFLSGKTARVDLQTIIRRRNTRAIGERAAVSDRFYSNSRDAGADWFSAVIRGRRSIENGLQWFLDGCFDEDSSCARLGNLAENLNVLRKSAPARLKAAVVMKGKKRLGVKRKRYRASLDAHFLSPILFGKC